MTTSMLLFIIMSLEAQEGRHFIFTTNGSRACSLPFPHTTPYIVACLQTAAWHLWEEAEGFRRPAPGCSTERWKAGGRAWQSGQVCWTPLSCLPRPMRTRCSSERTRAHAHARTFDQAHARTRACQGLAQKRWVKIAFESAKSHGPRQGRYQEHQEPLSLSPNTCDPVVCVSLRRRTHLPVSSFFLALSPLPSSFSSFFFNFPPSASAISFRTFYSLRFPSPCSLSLSPSLSSQAWLDAEMFFSFLAAETEGGRNRERERKRERVGGREGERERERMGNLAADPYYFSFRSPSNLSAATLSSPELLNALATVIKAPYQLCTSWRWGGGQVGQVVCWLSCVTACRWQCRGPGWMRLTETQPVPPPCYFLVPNLTCVLSHWNCSWKPTGTAEAFLWMVRYTR